MADEKKKKLQDFLAGKRSPEGKDIFETWYNSFNDTGRPEQAASEDTLKTELQKIKGRDVAGIRPERKTYAIYWKAAAVLIIMLAAGLALYIINRDALLREELTYLERYIPRGQRQHLVLADGTNVWLNADTRFRFPEAFGSATRQVYLEGEAFFEVQRDAERPFIIHTGRLTTTVLGTSFNVKAYSADNVQEVAVITGKVAVALAAPDESSEAVQLQPGQKAVLEKDKAALSTGTFGDMARYTSWKEGKLVFEDTPVSEVVTVISRLYDAGITIPAGLRTCRVTATFEAMPLKDMMDLLCLTLNTEYVRNGNSYAIQGTGCN